MLQVDTVDEVVLSIASYISPRAGPLFAGEECENVQPTIIKSGEKYIFTVDYVSFPEKDNLHEAVIQAFFAIWVLNLAYPPSHEAFWKFVEAVVFQSKTVTGVRGTMLLSNL